MANVSKQRADDAHVEVLGMNSTANLSCRQHSTCTSSHLGPSQMKMALGVCGSVEGGSASLSAAAVACSLDLPAVLTHALQLEKTIS